MQESIDNIVEKINFQRKDLFATFLTKVILVSKDTKKSTYAIHDNVLFKLDEFYKGFSPFNNEFGKDKKYEAGVEALSVIFEELGVEMDKEECFMLFHLRDLGKFRKRESEFHEELKTLWKTGYSHYAMEDGDFSYALKSLMRKKFIDYRRGNLYLNPTILIRYRTGR